MEEQNKNAVKNIGGNNYLNNNCWLVKNLGYSPYKRCQYCEQNFRNCLFMHYQVVSLLLLVVFLSLFLLIEKRLSLLAVTTVFTMIIVYGYFFNRSTEKIIQANFFLNNTKNDLKELTDNLEEKVSEQTVHLKELLGMKSDFLRVVNHQLNTPLSVMKGYFSMMEEGTYPTEKAIPPIKSGLERLSTTVSDFWDAYELEGERMKMDFQKTDIAEIVDRLIPEKQKLQLAQERKLIIKVEQPDFKIPVVWCDYKKITHVISNLLDNAVYYTSKGSVVVFYELLGDILKINVKDTGVGISEEDKKKLFKKFSRGGNATNLRPDGSGLGLFIAKKIVESNLGEITCSSDGGEKGSTFSFTVPVYTNQQAEASLERPISRKKITIFNSSFSQK